MTWSSHEGGYTLKKTLAIMLYQILASFAITVATYYGTLKSVLGSKGSCRWSVQLSGSKRNCGWYVQ